MNTSFARELAHVANRRGRLRIARAWAWWCAGVGGAALALGLIDAWVETPTWLRVMALMVTGASWARLVFWSARTLARARSTRGLGEVARLADSRLGLEGRRLQSAFELGRAGALAARGHGEPGDGDLGAALRERAAARALSALREAGGARRVLAAERRGSWRAAGAMLCVCGAVAAAAAWWPEPARAWWLRLAEPSADHPPFGATRLALSVEPTLVRQGDSVRVRALARGAEPERVWLEVQNERAGGVVRVEMERDREAGGAIGAASGAVFEAVLPGLTGPVRVTARSERGRSEAVLIEPLARAPVEAAWMVAEAPAGVEPARMVFHGRASGPGSGASWRVDAEVVEGDRLVLGIATGGPAWRASAGPQEATWAREGGALVQRATPANSGDLEWVADVQGGSAAGEGARVVMRARVKPDLAPTLEGDAGEAGPSWLAEDGALLVRAQATDDRGLGACGWSWVLIDESRRLVAMGAQRTDERDEAKSRVIEAVIAPAALGARAGEVLLVWFHAAELSGRTSGPRWAADGPMRIDVTEAEETDESRQDRLAMTQGSADGGGGVASSAIVPSIAGPDSNANARAGGAAGGARVEQAVPVDAAPGAVDGVARASEGEGAAGSAGATAGGADSADGRLVPGTSDGVAARTNEGAAVKVAATRARRFMGRLGDGTGAEDGRRAAKAGPGSAESAELLPLDAPPRQRQIVERYRRILEEGAAAARKETTP